MTLNSLKFMIFLIAVCLIYFVSPKKMKWLVLLVASYIFYFISSSKLIVYLILSTLLVYISTLLINRENNKLDELNQELSKEEKKIIKNKIKSNKKVILFISVIAVLGNLVVLKYSGFICNSINRIINTDISIPKFILPLGISYFTLQAISYIVDVYRGKYKGDKNICRVALYMAFFPSITEGPISRYDDLAPQLYEGHKFNFENIKVGITLIMFGLFKKMVIADRAALFVNNVFGKDYTGITVVMAVILYTIQIYAEFSGCMDIVRGSAKLFGINLKRNFERPFFSKSIAEFWRRWHITLGTWLRDYIFYPISLSKLNMKVNMTAKKFLSKNLSKFIAAAFPLFFVWFTNGIWHGASVKYIIYGLYYYGIMMLGLLLKPLFDKLIQKLKINVESKIYSLSQIIRTCLFVGIGMMLFRSKGIRAFIKMFMSMFSLKYTGLMNHGLNKYDFVILIIGVVILFIYSLMVEKGKDVYKELNKSNFIIKYGIYILFILMIIVFGIYGPGYDTSDFIYGQF